MLVRLEHVNLCVRDVDGMTQFLQTAFPDFQIRHDQKNENGSRWVHIGTHETYLTLNHATKEPDGSFRPYSGRPGVNHLAYEVDDVEAIRTRLMAAGYNESTPPNSHPHRKRVYFVDAEGNDWEFVQYFSDDPKERNDYEKAEG